MIQSIFVFMKQSLRQDSRLVSPSLMRLGILAITIMSLTGSFASLSVTGSAGLELIEQLVWWNLLIIGFLSIPYFSSAITEEKETQTIGLLRMTGIRNISLLLGKSFPRQLNALLLLTLQFPFMLLAITLGGVLQNQVLATYCVLISFLTLIANICLFSSVVCKTSRGATWFALFIIMSFPISVWILSFLSWSTNLSMFDQIGGFIWGIIPYNRVDQILTTGFSGNILDYQFYTNMGLGFFFFFLSWITFDIFVNSDLPSAEADRGLKQKTSKSVVYNGTVLKRYGRVWGNAIIWKEFYFTVGGMKYFKWKFLLYPMIAIIAVSISFFERVRIDESIELFAMVLQVSMIGAILLEPAISIAKMFRNEINWKTFTSLWLMPVSIGEIAIRKILGSLLGLVPAIFYLILGMIISTFMSKEIIVLDIVEGILSEPLAVMLTASGYLVFLSLIFLLSLLIKRGAIPLAIVFYGFFTMFVMMMFWGVGNGEGFLVLMVLMNLGLFSGMIYLSYLKMISLAASE